VDIGLFIATGLAVAVGLLAVLVAKSRKRGLPIAPAQPDGGTQAAMRCTPRAN